MSEGRDPLASPCINVCRMDETSGLCAGCFRTLDEIAAWGGASDEEKRAILLAVAQRRDKLGPLRHSATAIEVSDENL